MLTHFPPQYSAKLKWLHCILKIMWKFGGVLFSYDYSKCSGFSPYIKNENKNKNINLEINGAILDLILKIMCKFGWILFSDY